MAKEKDTLEYYQDKKDDWRWRRKAPNEEIVGASTEGFKNRKDCEANASRQQTKPITRSPAKPAARKTAKKK